MVRAEPHPRPEEVRERAHRLFVEGSDPEGLDPTVLREVLRDLPIRVEALGPSFHVESAARALHHSHPKYYFLIDRDHLGRSAVEARWREFPDPNHDNLLIWRWRELENYFLDPAYLGKSPYLTCTQQQLERQILSAAGRRLYFDAANLVIVQLREELKTNWIRQFASTRGFSTQKAALQKLLSRPEFSSKARSVSQKLRSDRIEGRFKKVVGAMLDGEPRPQLGRGRWLQMVRGKKMLPAVISKCFRVKDQQGKSLQGKVRVREVVRNLLARPLSDQPGDFQQLHGLLSRQVREGR